MRRWVVVVIFSILGLGPLTIATGLAATAGEPIPAEKHLISKDNFKLVQERLKAEGVYAGPVDGEMNAQTEAALRQYQQKKGIPSSGIVDEATLRELQISLPAGKQGEQ